MKFDGIDFSNPEELKKLVTGASPIVQSMMDFRMKMLKAFMDAQEVMLITFCKRHGIDIVTELVRAKRRQEMMKSVEIVSSDFTLVPSDGHEKVIQESWCVDRRGGKTGYERTYPRVQLILKSDALSFEVRIEDQEKEKTDGTDE